jgi:putative Holliday junction resolvase
VADEETPGESREETVLGVDYGTVRIGLALGFPASGLVVPLPTLPNPGAEEAVVTSLAEVARARGATTVVIGDPRHMSGRKSAGSRTAARLRDGLAAALGDVPVLLEDERLTSAEAEEQLRGAGLRWWQVAKGQVDALAAMGIVRGYLVRVNPSLLLAREDERPPVAPPDDPGRRRRDRRRNAQRRRRGGDEEG